MISVFLKCWKLIEHSAKKKTILITVTTIFFSFLDIVAVAIVGMIGSIAIRGATGQEIGSRTQRVIDLFQLTSLGQFQLLITLALLAITLFVLKSIGSYFFIKRIFLFMSNQATLLSKKIIDSLNSQTLDKINVKSSQEYIFQINQGTNIILLGIIATSLSIISDIVLFLSLICLLMLADWITALFATTLFVCLALTLNVVLQKHAVEFGRKTKSLTVSSSEKVVELLLSFREIRSRNTQAAYAHRIIEEKMSLAKLLAKQKMLPMFSKYVIESSALLIVLLVSILQFTLNDGTRAIGNLALFLAASSRISPAILRIQQGYLSIRSSQGTVGSTIELLSELDQAPAKFKGGEIGKHINKQWDSDYRAIQFKNVNFSYEHGGEWQLRGVTLDIFPNTFVALVGPSGSGKSTMVDLMFGLLQPRDGDVLIQGMNAREALIHRPGKWGYVPQSVSVHKGTILENLLLGLELTPEKVSLARQVLERVGLSNWLFRNPEGLFSNLGEHGAGLSGGERQRLGIARALMTEPEILVLDESTSSLDAVSEWNIANYLSTLKGQLTIIVIAHRLSTIKNADKIFYLDNGRLLAQGNFEELKELVPNFSKQARLMNL